MLRESGERYLGILYVILAKFSGNLKLCFQNTFLKKNKKALGLEN